MEDYPLVGSVVHEWVCPNCGCAATKDHPEEKDVVYSCYLTYVGSLKIQTIKILRAYRKMGIREAKEFIDNASRKHPQLIVEAVSLDLAKQISTELVEADCHVEVVRTNISKSELARIAATLTDIVKQLQR